MTVVTASRTAKYRLDNCRGASYIPDMATTGKTLRIERLRAEVTMVDLAARMGLSRQSLWVLERSAKVDPTRVLEYRAALNALRDGSQTAEGAA